MKKKLLFNSGLILFLLLVKAANCQDNAQAKTVTPLNMGEVKNALSFVRGCETAKEVWPRVVRYNFKIYNFKTDTFAQEEKTITLNKKPLRIIPHAVGVTDILWAICPRERLVGFNEFSADPEFSLIADKVRAKGPIFQSKQTELIIGYQPDLVFTVFYSGGDFKEKLKQAKIPYCDLGYFGTIESIKDQILLIGKIIGEENNAQALVKLIDDKIMELKSKLPNVTKPIRVLYYDEGGYIPGISSNFNSICKIINAINVGAEQGIKSWSQIDNETLLKWNPEVIVVPEGSNLKTQLMSNKVLSHAQAIKNNKVFYIPGVYLRVDSQYMVLSANLLAGIIYAQRL
ncbi:MAG: ABC transporter substrate-binding protein [Thermodesulfobacteriota bacterium]|nr:MAG: ABC transporter substrate-binding protein [Thermodesulfobacteriota bacterium]